MRWNILYIIIGVSLVLVGCSSDSTDERDDSGKTKQEHPLSMSMGMAPLQGEMRAAGDLPTGYSAYAYTTALAPINDIVCFLTADNTSSDQPEITTCHFIHEEESGNHVWKSRVVIQDGNYHLYGYMPNVSATNVSIAEPTGSYTDGAVITLTGLNAVMPEDICVIEGFKQYDTTIPDMSDAVGKFVFNTSNGDNLYVLASHIYAAMQIKMKLGTEYANLRKIKLRSITLTPVSGSDAASRVGAVITINGSGVQTVTFTTNSTETLPAMLYGVEGTELTTTAYQAFQAFLCPALPASSRYVMETRYDVYDRYGNLIRENESAENTLTHPSLAAGQKYDINITVNPTYLYQLSDPDLDDPTFTIDE